MKRIILALDVQSLSEAEKWIERLKTEIDIFKVGSILFSRCGPEIIKLIKKKGKGVFLDLKFHDIPHTAAGAVEAGVEMGVDMLTLHTLGGLEMLEVSLQAAEKRAKKIRRKRPLLFGVTILTSINEEILRKELGIKKKIKDYVLHLAGLAKRAGLDGIVAPGRDIFSLRQVYGDRFLYVVPGVRLKKKAGEDQKRVITPREAIKAGADYLVIGRPILQAKNPFPLIREITNYVSGK